MVGVETQEFIWVEGVLIWKICNVCNDTPKMQLFKILKIVFCKQFLITFCHISSFFSSTD